MQTSKYFLSVGVLAALILPLQARGGPDTEEQARMRAAMRRVLEQSSPPTTQAPATAKPANAPAPTQPATPPPPPEPAPTPVAPPPVQTQAAPAIAGSGDSADIAKARQAMRQRIQELQATSAPAPAPATTSVTPTTPVPSPAPATTFVATPPPDSGANVALEQEALRQKLQQLEATQPVTAAGYAPIEGPASPLSAAKQAKLADLLVRYKADTITAQEYHAQRAAILAAP